MFSGRREALVLALGFIVFLALPWAVRFLGQPFLVGVATRVLIYGIAAASLDLILGYGGMVSFGHAAFMGLGAYTVGILAAQLERDAALGTDSLLVAVPAAIAVAAVSALLGRRRGVRLGGV